MRDLGNDFHPAVIAADTTDLQAGTLVRVSEAFTRGAPAAAISGALSIYNTFLDYAGKDKIDTETAVRRFAGDEVGDYYAESKSAIDIVGFVGTAVAPISLGIKGLQLLRSGTALGNYAKGLGYAQSRSNYWLQQALKETAESGGTLKSILSSSARRKQLAWQSADQALLGTAAELALLITMNDSPIFDGDSISDFGWNFALGVGLSGTIGGALGSVAARGILKDAGRQVQAEIRLADTIFNPERMGLSKGTEIAAYMDSMLTRPDGLERIGFKYAYNGKWKHIPGGLDVTAPVKAAKENATKLAQQQIAIKFNELAQGNPAVGQAYSQFVFSNVDAARAAGKSPNEILERLHGYLENVAKIGHVDLERMALDSKKFYVNLKPTGDTPAEKLASTFSANRTKTTSTQAYILGDDVTASDLSIVRSVDLGSNKLKDIWRLAPDADAVQLADGSYRFNPASTKVKKLRETPHTVNMFIDVNTGTLSPQTVPVFGDTILPGKLVNTVNYISSGQRNFTFTGTVATSISTPPLEGTARHAWASGRSLADIIKVTGGTVDQYDIPLLQRISELGSDGALNSLNKISIKTNEGLVPYLELMNVREFIHARRLELLESQLATASPVPEARIIAANLGTTVDWVEQAVASGFRMPADAAPILQTADALRPQNVAVQWNFGVVPRMLPEDAYRMNMGPSFLASQELTRHYQVRIRQQVADSSVNASLGADAALVVDMETFLPDAFRSAAQSSNAEGAGSTVFGASNASYGERAKLAVQESGKNVALLTQKRRDAVVETLAPYINDLRNSPKASAELGILTTAIRGSEYRYIIDPNDPMRLISTEAAAMARRENVDIDAVLDLLGSGSRSPHSITMQSEEVAKFIEAHTRINALRNDKMIPLWNAVGLVKKADLDPVVYVPPINTVKYPYHAFVRTKQKVGLASDLSMITAKSEEQLRRLAAAVSDDFDVIYKADTNNYYKAKGEYDYGMTLNESAVNSTLAKRGVLADFFPETRLENIMEDYLQWHAKQEEKHIRTAVQVKNQRFFNEMNFLSEQYRKVSESVTRGIGSRFKSKISDPFGDYTKTALNISKQQEFPLLDSLNDFVDNVGKAAGDALEKGFRDARAGLISWEDANKLASDYGLGMPYRNVDDYITANERYPRNLVREGFQKANMFLATAVLRLDAANSLVNIISTPILLGTELSSIKQLMKRGDPLAGKFNELLSIAVPGREGARIPSTTKLLGNAVNNYFGPDKAARIQRYREIGAIKDVSQLYHEILDDLSFRPTIAPKAWVDKVNKAVERGATLTGNNFSEEFTRFVSADVMRQITDVLVAGNKMSIKEQNAYISTFVNRVQGNYVTSQRPILFQGTTGAAVSLFQTYAFNVLQQLFRHIESADKRTLAVFAGLQTSIFGLNGLPFFNAVNTHLIGGQVSTPFGSFGVQNNPDNKDAYSTLSGFNKELGDWLLYGSASAMPLFTGSAPALYTRGDINPRHITIIPTNPLDVPAVSASLKLYDAITGVAKNIGGGADVTDALLKGLEHQGLNRPLAGFAQLLAGQSTTSKGALISAANDLEATTWLGALAERTVEYGGVSRLLGARPMDEAVALNTLYRQRAYQAMDRARIERLGEVVKTKLYNNQVPTDEELEDFMLRYTRTGGRVENFQQAMQRWHRDANVSVVNQLAQKLNNPYGQTLQTIMGGERLPDYSQQE